MYFFLLHCTSQNSPTTIFPMKFYRDPLSTACDLQLSFQISFQEQCLNSQLLLSSWHICLVFSKIYLFLLSTAKTPNLPYCKHTDKDLCACLLLCEYNVLSLVNVQLVYNVKRVLIILAIATCCQGGLMMSVKTSSGRTF